MHCLPMYKIFELVAVRIAIAFTWLRIKVPIMSMGFVTNLPLVQGYNGFLVCIDKFPKFAI